VTTYQWFNLTKNSPNGISLTVSKHTTSDSFYQIMLAYERNIIIIYANHNHIYTQTYTAHLTIVNVHRRENGRQLTNLMTASNLALESAFFSR